MTSYQEFKKDLTWGFFLALVLQSVWYYSNIGRDETDGPGKHRSGLILRVDAGTGCQYLVNPKGGIIARADNTGKQICK